MNLIDYINRRNIAGLQREELRTVLIGMHPSLQVKFASNGVIMLTDNTVIKCVSEYYQNPNSNEDLKKYNNSTSKCYYVQRELNIENVPMNMCEMCHLRCLNMYEDKKLKRKYK